MKIAHISDLHCSREHSEEAIASLRFFAEHIKTSPVDMVAISGDVWDASMLNTEASGFTRFVEAIRNIADLAPVAVVYGTPSHDTDGSLEIFRNVTSNYGITILAPGQAYFLAPMAGGIFPESEANRFFNKETRLAIVFGVPEPRKKYLLADASVGKDETEAAIREAMHKLCFMLAAKRKEYPNIPCVVLYHGDVAGSSLQNDQTIERGTGISITIDDLADIGADYYALGHIHKPQQVGELPAYYAGSIYPKNFGETHKAGFNIAYINRFGEKNTAIERVDFPHPQNLKIELKIDDPDFDRGLVWKDSFSKNVKEKKVWFEITCSKAERALVDTQDILAEMLKCGAVEGSRVTISDIPTETIRAAAITEVKTPAQKFGVWAENTAIETKESVTQKINSLESGITDMARGSGLWEIESLRLRGAIGIKKGVGREEISIDFTKFDSGLIALVGNNGKGKTTLIENCNPYPHLLTRRGKLQSQFSLRDSFREVIYRNAQNNQRLKFLIQIDGQNKTGACKYFIFTQNSGGDFEPLPVVDGNLKPYEDALLSILGPAELYQRTAHIAQRPTKNLPDLTDATAGEKKALFVELAGIDYLQTISDAAAEKAKNEAAKTHDTEIKAQMLENAISIGSAAAAELKTAKTAIAERQTELSSITDAGKAAKAEVDRLREAYAIEEKRQQRETEGQRAIERMDTEVRTLEADKTRYLEAAKSKSAFENQLAENDVLQGIIKAETDRKNAVLEANMKAQSVYAEIKTAHDKKVKALEIERERLSLENDAVIGKIALAKKDIEHFRRDAEEIKENCPICGQKLPPEKIAELENRRRQFAAKIEKATAEIENFSTVQNALKAKIEAHDIEIAGLSFDEPAPPTLEQFDDQKLKEASGKAAGIDVNTARKNLDAARDAAVRIESLDVQISDKLKTLNEKRIEVLDIIAEGKAENSLGRLNYELNEAQTKHNELTERYTSCKSDIARYETRIEESKKRLLEIEAQQKELATLTAEITLSKTEAAEWELIAKGFGKDGVQALELDALAPGISETANRILESAYGDRFRIEIQTTRIGGAGKKTKQIEDFLIYVIDAEDGEPVLLEDKSGGEAVWIKRAIYDAFAVIRKRNTNFAFLTCFQDETDGALDSEAKTAYCRMLEAAHEESNLRHTIIITHSNEVKAMIEQKIDMAEFEAASSNAEGAKENSLW
jgi:DNA repair exonuclease SbcCD ATPase subunit/DNA repair exonuclease SbcCD nuclease subunit